MNKKRVLAMLLAGAMALSMTACGGGNSASTDDSSNDGARGLRGVLENVMTDIMFRIPSDETVCRVEITPGVVDGTGEPVVEHGERTAVPAEKKPPKKASRRKPTKSA